MFDEVDRGRAGRLAEGLDVGDRFNMFRDLVRVQVRGEYVKTRDPRYLEKAAEEALSGGHYLEHVLDLALWTPPQLLPPAATRPLAGVRHLVEVVDCGRLPEQLVVPCVVAKRKTDVVPMPPEEVPEVVRLGAERVVYAFCKAAGVIV